MARNANHVTPYTEHHQPQFMSLCLGKKKYLVDQSSIVAIEALTDVDCNEPSDNAAGWLVYENNKLPVYSFTDQLDLEHTIPENKAICVVLKHQEPCAALMCTEATAFKHNTVKLTPLPECTKASPSPIESICLCKIGKQDTVKFVLSAHTLLDYIKNCCVELKGTVSESGKLA